MDCLGGLGRFLGSPKADLRKGGPVGGLLTLLLYAGLFYLMMRFGCGAHMIHGHGGHGGHNARRFCERPGVRNECGTRPRLHKKL